MIVTGVGDNSMMRPALLYISSVDDARMLAQLPLARVYLTTPPERRFATFAFDSPGFTTVRPGQFADLGRQAYIYVICRQTTCGRHILARGLFAEGLRRLVDRAVSASEFTDFMDALRPPMPFTIAFPPGFSPAGKLLIRHHLTAGGRPVTCLFHEEPWLPEPRGALRDLL